MPLCRSTRDQLVALQPELLRYARKVARGNHQLAEDILQTANCNLLASTTYTENFQLKAYMCRAIANEWKNHCRKASTGREFATDPAELPVTTTAAAQHPRLELLDTLHALDTLNPHYSRAVLLSALGHSESSIAAHEHIAIGSAKSRTSRGRAALRQLAGHPASP